MPGLPSTTSVIESPTAPWPADLQRLGFFRRRGRSHKLLTRFKDKELRETTDDLSFARFHRMVAEKSEALKERAGCERVHFSVGVRDGRVQFKAKAEN